MLTPEEVRALSKILDARSIKNKGRPKPILRLITPPTPKLLDSISRDAHLKRIAFLERRYSLQWLVQQECFGVASVTLLEDCDLIRLLTMMERARECIADGVSFEDADLVRTSISSDAKIHLATSAVRDRRGEQQADQASIGMNNFCTSSGSKFDSDQPPF